MIPCGSTDAFAYSVLGTADPATAAIRAALGDRREVDAIAVKAGKK